MPYLLDIRNALESVSKMTGRWRKDLQRKESVNICAIDDISARTGNRKTLREQRPNHGGNLLPIGSQDNRLLYAERY